MTIANFDRSTNSKMKIVPLLKVKNINQAIVFYTGILDFELKYPAAEVNIFSTTLINGEAELQLTETDGVFSIAVTIFADKVDTLFVKYINGGLVTPEKENSPVHEGPVNQIWGIREFYVTDADGNTLRFAAPIK
jgi:catechol 2,3-dioxygenase-like lactoylglutathione lyase family enzyme